MANNYVLLTLDTTPPNVTEINAPGSVYYNDSSPFNFVVEGVPSPNPDVYLEDQYGNRKYLTLTLIGDTFYGTLDVAGLYAGQAFLYIRVKDDVLNESPLYKESFLIASSGTGDIINTISSFKSDIIFTLNNSTIIIDDYKNKIDINKFSSFNIIESFKSTSEANKL